MKRTVFISVILLWANTLCAQVSGPQSAPTPERAAPVTDMITVPPGQKFILQLETAIHTNSTRKGDRVEFKLAGDILLENHVIIPAQSWVRATVTKAKRAGRLMGRAEIQLRFDEFRLVDGTSLPIRASILRVGVTLVDAKDGQPRIKGEAGTGGSIGAVASAGAQGALIGVLTAGTKGAMYGGAAGAAIALGGMILRRGPDLDLPRDTMFEARLDHPLRVPLEVVQRAEQSARSRPTEEPPETVQRAEQSARSRPSEGPPETEPGDESIVRTKPVLRRGSRTEQPAAEPPADSPAQSDTGESSQTNPLPADIPPVQPAATPSPPDAPPVPVTEPPAPISGESRPTEGGGFKVSVNVKMVLVDVVVRDRAGRQIDSLSREDFRVYEDGVEQQIRSYSRDALPLAVALVVDRSGSVAPYIDELRRIANRALRQLKPGDKVALFSFANTVERIVDLTTDRQRIADGIDRIRAGGSTDLIDAIFDATTYLTRVAPDYRRAVILVSDNQPTVHPRASEGETIRMAMEAETVLYSLKTSGERIPMSMRLPNIFVGMGSVQKVAHETGGEVIEVANVGMLDSALTAVISRLRLRYALGYYPSNQSRGGSFRSIEVRLVERLGRPGSDYFMHARRGYYNTSDQSAAQNRP